MHEILFRGISKDTKKWVYGYYVVQHDRHMIYDDSKKDFETWCVEVIPETVGQYIGLKDKNDVKIFEEDEVKTKYGNRIIKWNPLHCCFALFNNGVMDGEITADWINADDTSPKQWNVSELEVIGNSHETKQ